MNLSLDSLSINQPIDQSVGGLQDELQEIGKMGAQVVQGDAPTNTGDPGSGFATELTVLGAWTPLLMEESLVKPGCLARHYLAPQVPVVVGHLQRFALQRTREQPPIRNSQQPATSHITSPITMS